MRRAITDRVESLAGMSAAAAASAAAAYRLPARTRPAESMTPQQRVDEVFDLLERHGADAYLGESISKCEHGIQCGLLAEAAGHSDHVVLGALLHDIGHSLDGVDSRVPRMTTDGRDLGTAEHDRLGAEYLESLLFPSAVTDFVRNHVQAKRYLVAKRPGYYQLLSQASRDTLRHQGGPMSDAEVRAFENLPDFNAFLEMRTWDEAGKDDAVSYRKELQRFKQLCLQYIVGKQGKP